MIGKICEITRDIPPGTQLQIGYPVLEDGSFVLITRDLGGGFFYVLSEEGQSMVSTEYLAICQALAGSENL